jgi:hypothetical protein
MDGEKMNFQTASDHFFAGLIFQKLERSGKSLKRRRNEPNITNSRLQLFGLYNGCSKHIPINFGALIPNLASDLSHI